MFNLFNENSACLTIECPLCRTKKSIQKSDINNFEKKSIIRCKCTCGCSFQKRLEEKDPMEMDLISANVCLQISDQIKSTPFLVN